MTILFVEELLATLLLLLQTHKNTICHVVWVMQIAIIMLEIFSIKTLLTYAQTNLAMLFGSIQMLSVSAETYLVILS